MSKMLVWISGVVLFASLNAQACPLSNNGSRKASEQKASSTAKGWLNKDNSKFAGSLQKTSA